jgi:hypothetical protein
MLRVALVLSILLIALITPFDAANAHGLRTAYVEIAETEPGKAIVEWRSAVAGATIDLRFGAPCVTSRREDQPERVVVVDCGPRLAGARIHVEGLGPILSEAVVRVVLSDGTSTSHLLTANSPSWELPGAESLAVVAKQYARLGVVHILTGADHLLFLLALVLCLRRARAVLLAETAFTLSHSLSFSAAALGWVHVSSRAAEACIALSLVLIALDVRARAPGSAAKGYGPLLAFAFGLVHGLGFAGGLTEIGLPEQAIPMALVSFGAGVELGQLAFLVVVFASLSLLARTRAYSRVALAGAYVVGGVGSFWLIERTALCFGVLM